MSSGSKFRLRSLEVSSSEEPTSSEEPSSLEEQINKEASKILWKLNTSWYTWTNQLGYQRPQQLPMLIMLTPQKQESLMRAYFSVYGNSADHVNTEWKSNDGTL
jgi:hypothetical protein